MAFCHNLLLILTTLTLLEDPRGPRGRDVEWTEVTGSSDGRRGIHHPFEEGHANCVCTIV